MILEDRRGDEWTGYQIFPLSPWYLILVPLGRKFVRGILWRHRNWPTLSLSLPLSLNAFSFVQSCPRICRCRCTERQCHWIGERRDEERGGEGRGSGEALVVILVMGFDVPSECLQRAMVCGLIWSLVRVYPYVSLFVICPVISYHHIIYNIIQYFLMLVCEWSRSEQSRGRKRYQMILFLKTRQIKKLR